MKLLRFFFRYSRRVVIFALLAGVVSGVCNTLLIALVNSSLRGGGLLSTGAILLFAALVLVLPVARFTSEALLSRLGQGALFELRTRLSRQILDVPLQRLDHLGAHRILATLTDDIPAITGALGPIPGLCINAAVLLGGLIYLGWLSPVMLFVTSCLLSLGVFGYKFAIRKYVRHIRLAREDGDRLLRHFTALTEGTKELKLHYERRVDFLSRTLRPTADSYRRHQIEGMTFHTAAASWGQSFVFVIIGLVVLLAPRLALADLHVLSGYVIVLVYITSPLQVILNVLPALGRASVAVAKVEQLGLELSADVEGSREEPGRPDPEWQELELRDVVYVYQREDDDAPFTLGPLNLTLRRGELVYITGGNGSGKTTFAKLLTGLYLPTRGAIYLDGRAVGGEEIEHYRQHFSAVFSDFYLFENFPGLRRRVPDTQVNDYLERLQLSQKVKFGDGRLSTLKLSQGQRKRLALLTAYLEGRPIYLFDEWAADQDPHFKDIFYNRLLPELRAAGKTVLVITHDDRYYHLADRLIKLEYGQVTSSVAEAAGARL